MVDRLERLEMIDETRLELRMNETARKSKRCIDWYSELSLLRKIETSSVDIKPDLWR